MLKQTIENMSRLTRCSLSETTWDDAEFNALRSLGKELSSSNALESIKLDPYWPKWDSPWWKALLLSEAGMSELIPKQFVEKMVEALDESGLIRITEDKIAVEGSLVQNGSVWEWNEIASRFPALDVFGKVGMVSLPLSRQWLTMLEHIQHVVE